MKKLVAMAMAALAAVGAWAYTATVDGITWTFEVVDGKAEIYNNGSAAILMSTTGAITIPATLGDYPVNSIGGSAFLGCSASLFDTATIPGVKPCHRL